jgi:hypothetical protein
VATDRTDDDPQSAVISGKNRLAGRVVEPDTTIASAARPLAPPRSCMTCSQVSDCYAKRLVRCTKMSKYLTTMAGKIVGPSVIWKIVWKLMGHSSAESSLWERHRGSLSAAGMAASWLHHCDNSFRRFPRSMIKVPPGRIPCQEFASSHCNGPVWICSGRGFNCPINRQSAARDSPTISRPASLRGSPQSGSLVPLQLPLSQ